MPLHNLQNILIITYARAINYGSALQAFALNRYLTDNGFNVKTIDYTTETQQKLYRIFEPTKSMMAMFRNIQSILNYRKLKEHHTRFEEFIKTYIPMTKVISTSDELESISSDADYLICGSDQIWNADCDDFDSNYMLSFVSDKSKCISYAPSLGAGASSEKTVCAIKKYAINFKALSSREESGANTIAHLTGREVSTVSDPVFLLSEEYWKEIASDRLLKKDYILGYFIGDRAGMRDFAKKMSKSTNLPVIVIYKNLRDIRYGFRNIYECGPSDFISLIQHSKGIVTNSFHAVAFSLIFKKDFWVFTGKASTDSRISGLLNMVGLSERIIDESHDAITDYLAPIQYSDKNLSRLQQHIADSKYFLLNNLS